MIEVTLTGVPDERFTRQVEREPDGTVRLNFDEAKHDQFDILLRSMKLCGYVEPENDPAFDVMMKARTYRLAVQRALTCERAKRGCPHPNTCDRLRKCQAWPW